MEQLIEILEDIKDGVDFRTETGLIDKQILSSFDILAIIGELSEEFDIEITPVDIVPSNFNSAEALWAMIQRLQEA